MLNIQNYLLCSPSNKYIEFAINNPVNSWQKRGVNVLPPCYFKDLGEIPFNVQLTNE